MKGICEHCEVIYNYQIGFQKLFFKNFPHVQTKSDRSSTQSSLLCIGGNSQLATYKELSLVNMISKKKKSLVNMESIGFQLQNDQV